MATSTEERKINIILDGKQVNASLREMEAAASVMNNQLKKMSADDPGRKAMLTEFKQMKDRITDAKQELYGMEKAQKSVATSGGFMKTAFASAFGFFAAGGIQGIISQIGTLFSSSKQAFEESAQINAQLEASLKSTGEAAGITKEEIEKIANVQMGKTLFDDDVTKKAASLLLTFTDIKKGVFEDALPAIQDMAQKMAGDGPADLKGATIQVGKALNDPIKGITALSKVGVSFTEQQKEQIKAMVETGDKAGAQKLILAELNKEFGGSAEAARKAAGGMGELKMQLGEAQEELGGFVHEGLEVLAPWLLKAFTFGAKMVLWLKEMPAFVRENKDVFITLGVAIAALSFENTKAAATTLYHTTVEKGRAIATRATAAGQWLLNAAMTANPIGLVVAAVAALVGGFVILYNRSEAVRGGIAGLWSAFKEFLSIAGDVVSVLLNPIKNAGKIKEIMNSGERLGKAFSDGYNNKIAEEQAAKEKKDAANVEVKKKAAAKNGGDIADAETAAEKKAREKAEKEAEKKRKERDAKLLRDREEFNKAVAKSELELAKLKVEVMDEGIDKVLAKLKLQRDEELKEIQQKRHEILENEAATVSEKEAMLDNLRQQADAKNNEYDAAVKAAKEGKRKEDLDKELTTLDEEEELKRVKLEGQFINVLDAEQKKEEALLELKRTYLQKKLDLLIASGQGESLEAIKIKNALLQTDKEQSDAKIENAKRVAALKKWFEEQGFQTASSFLQLGIDLLGKDEAARKKNASAIKVFTAAKIMTDLYSEISGYMNNPVSTAAFGIPGAIQSGIAFIRARKSISDLNAQKFADGGGTIPMELINGSWQMASGYSGGSIGTFAAGGPISSARLGLIGEAGAEWVGPNWMLTSPKYANIFSYLESERRGGGVRAFADGGATAAASVPANAQAADLSALIAEIRMMGQKFDKVERWANSIKVDYHAGSAEEAMQTRQRIQENSSW